MSNRVLAAMITGGIFLFIVVPASIAPEDPIEVALISAWGAAISVALALVVAIAWIVISHGKPLGERDVRRDRESPLLRISLRWGLWFAAALVVIGLVGCVFAVYWYPNAHPHGLTQSPEEYALGLLIGAWVLLGWGTTLLLIQLYWFRAVRRSRTGDAAGR